MRPLLLFMLAATLGAPAAAQDQAIRQVGPIAGRTPTLPPEVVEAAVNAKLRDEVAQLTARVAKMQDQLDRATNDIWLANANLQKLASMFNNHTHVVNGMVGVGLTSTIDGDKAFFRYVIPPYNNEDGLQARRTGTPVPAKN